MTVIRTNRQIGRDGAAPYEHHTIERATFHLKQFCRTEAARRAVFAGWAARYG